MPSRKSITGLVKREIGEYLSMFDRDLLYSRTPLAIVLVLAIIFVLAVVGSNINPQIGG